jgi:K+/H+ antiporter YhaU regulatory subunit KhtT
MSSHTRIHVRENAFPGTGRAYEMLLEDGRMLVLAIDGRTEVRTISVLSPGRDEPDVSVELDDARALTAAALIGSDWLQTEPSDHIPGARVETVTVREGSVAVGMTLEQLEDAEHPELPDPNAARVLAVIRDDTPELVEDDPSRPCRPGDRLVIAGHPGPLVALRHRLDG